MAGQQGLGLAQGFMQGYGFMDQIDKRERGMQLREQQSLRATESHRRQGEQHDLTMDQARLQQEQQQAQQSLAKLANGLDLSEEETEFFRQNPKYWPALDPETDKSLETARSVMDPDKPTSMRSPETIEAINQMFGHRINRGEGGRKRIDGIYPGKAPGTVAFSVEVEGEDGKKYRAPMTVNRGTEGDDEVLQTPVEDVLGQVKGYDLLRQPFRASPEAQARATKMLMALRGETPERTKGMNVDGRLVDPYTGDVMADLRDPQDNDRYGEPFEHPELGWGQTGPDGKFYQMDPPGSSNKAPADVQTAEWMVSNGIAGDLSEAYELVSTSKTNPSSFISRYVSAASRNQDEYDPDKKSMRELTEEARQVYEEIVAPNVGRSRGQGGQQQGGNGQPAGLQMIDSSTQVLPEDGSAVPGPDGGMQGRVDRGGQQQGLRQPQQSQPQRQQGQPQFRPFRPGEQVQNPDGSHSTERSITVGIDDRYMNIPTLWMTPQGPQQLSEEEAVQRARQYMQQTGESFPSFSSVDEAVAAAEGRSNAGGAGSTQGGGQQSAQPQQQQPRQQAPAAAIEHLRKNPDLADQFRAKYGYLPEGF